mmetsp:Transcript_33201/g.63979  ORF Transcript_33201/g.63979 Transcript_33201/m.63979 type:complete len:296 (+) Transcript_33201:3042-3929(+)
MQMGRLVSCLIMRWIRSCGWAPPRAGGASSLPNAMARASNTRSLATRTPPPRTSRSLRGLTCGEASCQKTRSCVHLHMPISRRRRASREAVTEELRPRRRRRPRAARRALLCCARRRSTGSSGTALSSKAGVSSSRASRKPRWIGAASLRGAPSTRQAARPSARAGRHLSMHRAARFLQLLTLLSSSSSPETAATKSKQRLHSLHAARSRLMRPRRRGKQRTTPQPTSRPHSPPSKAALPQMPSLQRARMARQARRGNLSSTFLISMQHQQQVCSDIETPSIKPFCIRTLASYCC